MDGEQRNVRSRHVVQEILRPQLVPSIYGWGFPPAPLSLQRCLFLTCSMKFRQNLREFNIHQKRLIIFSK